MYKKIILLNLILLFQLSFAQSNLDRQVVNNLLGKTVKLTFDNGLSTFAKIADVKWIQAGQEYIAVFSMVNDLGEYFTQDQLKTVRTIESDGKGFVFDLLSGGLAQILHLINLQDLSFEYSDIRNIMKYFTRTYYRKKELHGTVSLKGKKYFIQLTLSVSKYSLSGGTGKTHTFLIVDNVKVIPDKIPLDYDDGKVTVTVEFLINNLPYINSTVGWESEYLSVFGKKIDLSGLIGDLPGFAENNFWLPIDISSENELVNEFSNENNNLGIRLYFKELGDWWSSIDLGNVKLEEGILPPVPQTPSLEVTSNMNSIIIGIKNFLLGNKYIIYKSSYPFSQTTVKDSIIVSNKSYEDKEVVGGVRYYYKAVAKNDVGQKSDFSDVVTGMPLTKYKFNLVFNQNEIYPNEIINLPGELLDINDFPLSDAIVSANFLDASWSMSKVETNSIGHFDIKFRAPTIRGNYKIKLIGGKHPFAANKEFVFTVNKPLYEGHELNLTNSSVNGVIQTRNSNIQHNITLQNDGLYNEKCEIISKLLDQDGNKLLSRSDFIDINSGQEKSVNLNFPISYNVPFGNYVLMTDVKNDDNLDMYRSNNRIINDIYIDSVITTPVYQTKKYSINELNTNANVNGILVKQLDINKSDSTVKFQIGSEVTPYLSISSEGEIYWINTSQNFMILPTYLAFTDTTFFIQFIAGKSTSSVSCTPSLSIVKKGHSSELKISGPSSSNFNQNYYNFPFGNNSDEMKAWFEGFNYNNNNNYSMRGVFNIPQNQTFGYYQSYFSWKDENYTYYKSLRIKVVPVHDLQLAEDFNVYNNENEFLPGDTVIVEGSVENNGDFSESPIVQMNISYSDSIIFSSSKELSIYPKGEEKYYFVWSSLAQPIGKYKIQILVPNNEDESNSNNSKTKSISLEEISPLNVRITPITKIYEVGDTVNINVSVTNKDSLVIENAIVHTKIISPDKTERELFLEYNNHTQNYEGKFRANIGGNYKIFVDASHYRYLSNNDESIAQVYVDISLLFPARKNLLTTSTTGYVECSSVGNLSSIALDINYNNNLLDFYKIKETSYFNESQNITTSLNYNNSGNTLIVGLTRLASHKWGAISHTNKKIMTVSFVSRDEGDCAFSLDNVGLFDNDGLKIASRIKKVDKLTVYKQSIALTMENDTDSLELGQDDTLVVYAANAYNLKGVVGDISFDPQKIIVKDLLEENTFNQNGKVPTIFNKKIDNDNGKITFGIVRSENPDEGISTSVDKIAKIVYKPLKIGRNSFSFTNSGILSAYEDVYLPHKIREKVVEIIPYGKDTTFLELSANSNYISIDSSFNVYLDVSHVADAYAFVGNILYEKNKLRFLSLKEGSFFNNGGTDPTTLNYYSDTTAGNITLGLSRLGPIGGVSTVIPKRILTLTFKKLTNDSTEIQLSNTGILLPDGETSITHQFKNIKIYNKLLIPSVPKLKYPLNNQKGLISNNLSLVWHKSDINSKFTLQLSTDSLFQNTIIDTNNILDTTFSIHRLQNYSVYYWRVKAVGEDGESDWSEVWSFKTLGEPTTVTLLNPEDDAVNVPIEIDFLWTKASDLLRSIKGKNLTLKIKGKEKGGISPIQSVSNYWFQLTKDVNGDPVISDEALTDTTKHVTGLENNTEYWWRVSAKNEAGWGSWTEWSHFTTIIDTPEVVTLNSPENNSVGLVQPIELKWNESSRAETYSLQVSTDENFTTLLVDTSGITSTTFSLPALENLTKYYWRVSGSNVGGTSQWSEVWNFKTIGEPTTVNLIYPPNDTTNLEISVQFVWSAAIDQILNSNAVPTKKAIKNPHKNSIKSILNYWFELSVDTSAEAQMSINDLTDTTLTVDSLENNTWYYWRVAAQNEAGWGAFTKWNSFKTIVDIPEIPVPIYPLNSDVLVDTVVQVEFIWSSSENSESYELMISLNENFDSLFIDTTGIIDTTLTLYNDYKIYPFYWKVRAANIAGLSDWSETIFVPVTLTLIENEETGIPKEYELGQNYPNPFNPSTIIKFSLPEENDVKLTIFNILGQEVAILVNRHLIPGNYKVEFDASNLPSGIYLYKIEAGKFSDVKKMMLIK